MPILKVELAESAREIERRIAQSLKKDLATKFNVAVRRIIPEMRRAVKEAILDSPEYTSMVVGALKYELGIPDLDRRMEEIIDIWLKNIVVVARPPKTVGNSIRSTVVIQMIRSDYSDVIDLNSALFVTEKGSQLEWLRWMLLSGSQDIVKEYDVVYGNFARSRTGGAVMKKDIGNWSVPEEFQGTRGDNFVTRALSTVEDTIFSLLKRNLS